MNITELVVEITPEKKNSQIGSTDWVHRLGPQIGSTDWVHRLGLQIGSTDWVHRLGPHIGSTDWSQINHPSDEQ